MNNLPIQKKTSRFSHALRLAPWGAAVLGVLVVGYVGYQFKNLLRGPVISVEQPPVAEASSPLWTVSGQANRIAYLYLNDAPIFTDEAGHFNQKLLLTPGYNIITVRASDKFEREIVKELQVIYTPSN